MQSTPHKRNRSTGITAPLRKYSREIARFGVAATIAARDRGSCSSRNVNAYYAFSLDKEVQMAERPRNATDETTVDRRGTSLMVPIGIAAVFAILIALMIVRSFHDDEVSNPARPQAVSGQSN
jgi:hypothetical protein